ncbi:MAG: AmmeMemoRadiSam system radical SAM enzyme [Mangrovibacterium sp.]
MHEALFYTKLKDNKVKCQLCPTLCELDDGDVGNCGTRKNHGGMLVSEVYGQLAAINIDPIEKKPLYHFFPGGKILSVGTVGCNFHCDFCQNYSLSQCVVTNGSQVHSYSPDELVDMALSTNHNLGLAFTYNEPTVFYEFMVDAAVRAHEKRLVTAMVSNGYLLPHPLEGLLPHIDAFNIDLKAFNENFYRQYCQGMLKPVLKTLRIIARAGNHLELTNLIIPGLNDDEAEFTAMCRWIANELGRSTVLHLSRYFPAYKMKLPPTPSETMFRLYDLAKEQLHHVYLGNMTAGDHDDTFCPHCGHKLIERNAYHVRITGLDEQGRCANCQTPAIKYFSHAASHS